MNDLLTPFRTFSTTSSKRLRYRFLFENKLKSYFWRCNFSFLFHSFNLLRYRDIFFYFLSHSAFLLLGRCITRKEEYRWCRKLVALLSFYNPSNVGSKASICYDKLIIKLYPFVAPSCLILLFPFCIPINIIRSTKMLY